MGEGRSLEDWGHECSISNATLRMDRERQLTIWTMSTSPESSVVHLKSEDLLALPPLVCKGADNGGGAVLSIPITQS